MNTNCRLINQKPDYDRIINSEVLLQHVNDLQAAKTMQISIGLYVTVSVEYDDKLMLNSIAYDVGFPYGTIREYAAGFIAENMLTQVDEDGYTLTLMEGIIDYNKDEKTLSN